MLQWSIKELSDLTGVSVRTLHHYDHIDLLKPSVRSANRYRWYAESDLVKLQQILALKSFGFGLDQIKNLLQQQPNMLDQLRSQEQMLSEQVASLHQMQKALTATIEQLQTSESLDWQNVITLIERYHMMEELKKSWAGKALDEAQFAQYVAIREQHPKVFAAWEKTIAEINTMQLGDPEGAEGERVVKAFYALAKKTKSCIAEQRKFGASLLRSIKDGRLTSLPLSPEGGLWLSRAMLAHWLRRWEEVYAAIVKNMTSKPTSTVGKRTATMWRTLIADHFVGTSPELAIGSMMWQEAGRQQAELAALTTLPSPQEMIKKVHVKLFFDPAAFSWIEEALAAHPQK